MTSRPKKRIGLHLEAEVWDQLKEEADSHGLPLAVWVKYLLDGRHQRNKERAE